MRKNNANASRGNLVIFRLVCVVMSLILVISAIAFSSHHLGSAGLISLLFAFGFLLLLFVQKNPGIGWWLTVFGLALVWLILLAAVI
jgi:hypothetical protein